MTLKYITHLHVLYFRFGQCGAASVAPLSAPFPLVQKALFPGPRKHEPDGLGEWLRYGHIRFFPVHPDTQAHELLSHVIEIVERETLAFRYKLVEARLLYVPL